MNLINQQFHLSIPTEIIFGKDVVKEKLPLLLNELKVENILLVCDRELKKIGFMDSLGKNLIENGFHVTEFYEIDPNPSQEAVHKGRDLFIENKCEVIIGLGGGSSIDAAKGIAVAVVNKGDVSNYGRGKNPIEGPLPTTIIIPTTAGTGSEVTNVAVITDYEEKKKFVLASHYVKPNFAIIDPTMTYTLPQSQIASTGIDAMVHCIESFVNNRSQPISDAFALYGFKMLYDYLPISYADPTSEEAKAQVLLGSTIAGLAFANTGTGLVHSLSHPVTSWFNVPHGLANAVILPHVIAFNLIANYGKYAELAYIINPKYRELTKREAAEKLVDELRNYTYSLNIPKDFSYLNIDFDEKTLEGLVHDTLNDKGTFPNNPRRATEREVRELYKQVLGIKE